MSAAVVRAVHPVAMEEEKLTPTLLDLLDRKDDHSGEDELSVSSRSEDIGEGRAEEIKADETGRSGRSWGAELSQEMLPRPSLSAKEGQLSSPTTMSRPGENLGIVYTSSALPRTAGGLAAIPGIAPRPVGNESGRQGGGTQLPLIATDGANGLDPQRLGVGRRHEGAQKAENKYFVYEEGSVTGSNDSLYGPHGSGAASLYPPGGGPAQGDSFARTRNFIIRPEAQKAPNPPNGRVDQQAWRKRGVPHKEIAERFAGAWKGGAHLSSMPPPWMAADSSAQKRGPSSGSLLGSQGASGKRNRQLAFGEPGLSQHIQHMSMAECKALLAKSGAEPVPAGSLPDLTSGEQTFASTHAPVTQGNSNLPLNRPALSHPSEGAAVTDFGHRLMPATHNIAGSSENLEPGREGLPGSDGYKEQHDARSDEPEVGQVAPLEIQQLQSPRGAPDAVTDSRPAHENFEGNSDSWQLQRRSAFSTPQVLPGRVSSAAPADTGSRLAAAPPERQSQQAALSMSESKQQQSFPVHWSAPSGSIPSKQPSMVERPSSPVLLSWSAPQPLVLSGASPEGKSNKDWGNRPGSVPATPLAGTDDPDPTVHSPFSKPTTVQPKTGGTTSKLSLPASWLQWTANDQPLEDFPPAPSGNAHSLPPSFEAGRPRVGSSILLGSQWESSQTRHSSKPFAASLQGAEGGELLTSSVADIPARRAVGASLSGAKGNPEIHVAKFQKTSQKATPNQNGATGADGGGPTSCFPRPLDGAGIPTEGGINRQGASHQMTIFYRNEIFVLDHITPQKAKMILGEAGEQSRTWSTQTVPRTSSGRHLASAEGLEEQQVSAARMRDEAPPVHAQG